MTDGGSSPIDSDAGSRQRKRRPWLVVVGVALVALAIIGGIAVKTIRPVGVAVLVTVIIVLIIIAVGMLPRGLRKWRRSKNAQQQTEKS